MADDRDTIDQAHRFLGKISQAPVTHTGGADAPDDDDLDENAHKDDAEKRAGSRDVDQGGGVASEVGGTLNYHHSGGATGGDLGNRPE
jgi:hypothetical protein